MLIPFKAFCYSADCGARVNVDAETFAAIIQGRMSDRDLRKILCDDCANPRPPHVGSISHRHYEPGDEALPSQESAIRAMEDGPCSA